MFSYKANAICMAGMTMPAGAGVAASHYWNRVRRPGQLINYAWFWPHRWTFAKNRTAHAQTHYRKSIQWQWASFVSARGSLQNYFKALFQSHHINNSRLARSAYDCWQGAAFSLWLITGSLICLSNLFVLKITADWRGLLMTVWQGAAISLWHITGSLICLCNLFVLKKSELLLTKACQFQTFPTVNLLKFL